MMREQALQLYRDGLGCKLVARRTGVSYATVARWARQSGILRTRKQAGLVKAEAHPIQWGDLNPERAWVLGLIYGNGGIRADGSYVSLDAENCDVDVLLKAKTILGHGSTPFSRSGNHRINFCSRRFVADLKSEFDLDENKCYRMPWPTLADDLLPHFVRGLLDSDGSWYSRTGIQQGSLVFAYSSAARAFVERLETAIFLSVDVCSKTVEECPARQRPMRNSTISGRPQFRLAYAHFDSVELGQWLYANASDNMRGARKFSIWDGLRNRVIEDRWITRHERHRANSRANRLCQLVVRG